MKSQALFEPAHTFGAWRTELEIRLERTLRAKLGLPPPPAPQNDERPGRGVVRGAR